jgi:hypothetical protein
MLPSTLPAARKKSAGVTRCRINHDSCYKASGQPHKARDRLFSIKSFEWKLACDMANSKAGTALRALLTNHSTHHGCTRPPGSSRRRPLHDGSRADAALGVSCRTDRYTRVGTSGRVGDGGPSGDRQSRRGRGRKGVTTAVTNLLRPQMANTAPASTQGHEDPRDRLEGWERTPTSVRLGWEAPLASDSDDDMVGRWIRQQLGGTYGSYARLAANKHRPAGPRCHFLAHRMTWCCIRKWRSGGEQD